MLIQAILLTIAAYLLGSVPAAYVAAKLARDIDLREFGSGNVGVGNLLQATHSIVLTAMATIFDFNKGLVMVWTTRMLGLDLVAQVIVGLAAIAGHNWSVFLHFSAGRGVLTTGGVAFFLFPWGILVFVSIAAFTLLRRASALPMLCAIAGLSLASWLIHEPMPVTIALLAMFLMMVIRRLTAPLTAHVPINRALLVNRLLFDRDVNDGEAWEKRGPEQFKHQRDKEGDGKI